MVKFRFKAAPLPANFLGTPQNVLDAFLERLEIDSDASSFSSSSTQPVGNEGPWFKNGNELFVWDETTSTYIPLDFTASHRDPIWVGDTEPDKALYQIWLKTTDTTNVGLFYWTGSVWITQELGIADLSVTASLIEDGAVTTNKIRDLAVTVDLLPSNIPMTKWASGPANFFIRTKADGSEPEWRRVFFESAPVAFASLGVLAEIFHGLDAIPHEVSIVAVYNGVSTYRGVDPGEEFCLSESFPQTAGNTIIKSDESIRFSVGAGFSARFPDGNLVTPPDMTLWKLKVRYSAP